MFIFITFLSDRIWLTWRLPLQVNSDKIVCIINLITGIYNLPKRNKGKFCKRYPDMYCLIHKFAMLENFIAAWLCYPTFLVRQPNHVHGIIPKVSLYSHNSNSFLVKGKKFNQVCLQVKWTRTRWKVTGRLV